MPWPNNIDDVSLHIIGSGPDVVSLRKLAASLSSAARIQFYGRLPNTEVLKLLPTFHCLVNNSRVESFGVTILEAHAAGIPVISTTCGGPDEWLEQGDLAIPVEDDAKLLQAMTTMLANDQTSYSFDKYKVCLPDYIAESLNSIYSKMVH